MKEESIENKIVLNTKTDVHMRVLWIGGSGEPSWWIAVDSTSNVPKSFSLADALQKLNDGRYKFVPDQWSLPAAMPWEPKELTDAEKKCRDRRWALLKDVLVQEPAIYNKSFRASILKDVAEKNSCSATSLSRLLGIYWKRGKTADAFIPRYSNCGVTSDDILISNSKFGRHAVTGPSGKKLTETDYRNFEAVVAMHIGKGAKFSLHDLYDNLIENYYSEVADKNIEIFPNGKMPTRGQFLYWYRKHRNDSEEYRAKNGDTAYQLNCRPILGRSEEKSVAVGVTAQIDATIADIYLVRQHDRHAIVGRPTMYFIQDVTSRMVIGMHITLSHPSCDAAMMTILNAAEDKVEYCKRFGIDIVEEDWPCHLIPDSIVGDRGEMESRCVDQLVTDLGINIVNTPPYRGDLKGIIERTFRTIQVRMLDIAPGKVFKDSAERGKRDPRLDARLDIRQFTRVIIKCVLEHNNINMIKNFPVTAQMSRDKVRTVPIEMWNYGIRYSSGILRHVDIEKVKFCVLPKETAMVTARGIIFHKMQYTCETAEKEQWFEKARKSGNFPVTVACDPRNVSTLYVKFAAGQRPLECTLLDCNKYFDGWNLEEVITKNEDDRAELNRYFHQAEQGRVETNHFIKNEYEEAEKMYAAAPKGESKAKQISMIEQNRAAELDEVEHDVRASGDAEHLTCPTEDDGEGQKKTVSFFEHIVHTVAKEKMAEDDKGNDHE